MSLRLMTPTTARLSSFVRPASFIQQIRFNSSSVNKGMAKQRPAINKIGVPFQPFVPVRASRRPNLFTSPKLFFINLYKLTALTAFNVYQRWKFSSSMGKNYKPNYIKWNNDVIDVFVKVNTAFSERKIEKVRDLMSDYVYFALGKRQASLPKNISLGWDLIKFNSKPKLMSFYPFPHDDGSTLLVQVTYRFETKQRLTFKKHGSKEIKEEVKDLVEYLSFNVDPYTEKVILAGSVFESPITRELSAKSMPSQEETINNMIANGDIYRIEPAELEQIQASKK
ncbi:unnamed protein product [Ambrosiozyma monospora]|uniref:Unnamed protein product n=1 Tax=Ambrosiozyma monospora TaxID=43982 RepID=A0ACB5T126_AMBMO|nr:unnamed protein product [Ambrosiozyma monospora]